MQAVLKMKKLFVFLYLLVILVCCCGTQAEKSVLDLSCIPSSVHSLLQVPKARAELPAMLDEEQWSASDDAASHDRLDHRKSGAARKNFGRLFLFNSLLMGLSALFAYLFAGVFHGSSCPTYGLSCILKFIQNADGRKENISFSYIY